MKQILKTGNPMKKIVFLAMICGWSVAGAQPASYRFTLEDCLSYVMGNGYIRQSMRLSEQAAGVAYDQSKLERLPGVSASGSENLVHSKNGGTSWNGSYGVDASMALYNGGSISNTIRDRQLRVDQAGYATQQYDNTLTVRILESFLSVLGNEELLRYQRSIAEASRAGMEQGKAQVHAGTILESDYLLLESQYASDMNNIADSEIARTNSLLTLKSLLSMELTSDLQIIYPDSATVGRMEGMPAMDEVLERAKETMPDFRINRYDVELADLGVKLARAGYMPSLALGASAGTGHSTNFQDYGSQLSNSLNERVGVSLSVPLFNNGRTRSKVAQSRIAADQARLDEKQSELDLLQQVASQYLDVVSAEGRYHTADKRQNAYLRSFEAYRAQFNAGAITPVDLLQQQNNYISALNDYIQAKYGFMLRRKILDIYMGVPVTM